MDSFGAWQPVERGGEMRGWQPVHTVGTILTIVGIGVIFASWYWAIQSRGLLISWMGVGGGPVLLVRGLSQLVFPRAWVGPDGNEIKVTWRAEVGTLVLGLLLGLASVFAVKALVE
jgi:hypothetical protein